MNNKRYKPYYTKLTVVGGEMRLQLEGIFTGDKREAYLVVHRDTVTNELSLDVVTHYSDPESEKWFPDSDPWLKSELRND